MSTSSIKSNLAGKNGTETISNFASMTGALVESTGKVKAGTYMQIGAHQYIMVDTSATPAVILANATAIDNSIANSFVLGNKQMHFIVSNATINTINATALN